MNSTPLYFILVFFFLSRISLHKRFFGTDIHTKILLLLYKVYWRLGLQRPLGALEKKRGVGVSPTFQTKGDFFLGAISLLETPPTLYAPHGGDDESTTLIPPKKITSYQRQNFTHKNREDDKIIIHGPTIILIN